MIEWRAILAVALGAALGGVARYLIGQIVVQRLGPGIPYGTLFINVTGSFLIGVIATLATTRALGGSPLIRLFLMTGILGGYTTFSTFSLDTLTLIGDGAGALAAWYAGVSVALGVLGAYAGAVLARLALR